MSAFSVMVAAISFFLVPTLILYGFIIAKNISDREGMFPDSGDVAIPLVLGFMLAVMMTPVHVGLVLCNPPVTEPDKAHVKVSEIDVVDVDHETWFFDSDGEPVITKLKFVTHESCDYDLYLDCTDEQYIRYKEIEPGKYRITHREGRLLSCYPITFLKPDIVKEKEGE